MWGFRPLVLAAALATASLASARAHACGVTAGGAAGLGGCSLAEHEEEARPKWRAGASYAFTSTILRFTGQQRVEQVRHAAIATLERRPTPRLALLAGAGGFGGHLTRGGDRWGLSPGVVAAVGASYRAVDPSDAQGLFMLLTSQLSVAASRADDYPYTAVDLRLGVVFGKTFAERITPYGTARIFGGPILWRLDGAEVQGTDVNKYQVAGGVAVLLGRSIDLFVEGVPLGERGFAAGAGAAF